MHQVGKIQMMIKLKEWYYNNNYCLLRANHISVMYQVLRTLFSNQCYYQYHFIDEKSETQQDH